MRGAVGDYASKRLGHQVRVERLGDKTIHTYVTFPVPVRRPAHGASVSELSCGECGTRLRVRVRNAAGTRWARRVWLAAAVPSLLLTAAAIFVFVQFDRPPPDNRPYVTPLWVELSFIPAGLGIAAFLLCVLMWWHTDGVRLISNRGWEHQLVYAKRRKG
ncbi:hypothetical protein K1W54_05475 [Micromonospora sp. CPCC 205371]|nr:hypothetical protein [Micromonospora sp. CPCC 205371]